MKFAGLVLVLLCLAGCNDRVEYRPRPSSEPEKKVEQSNAKAPKLKMPTGTPTNIETPGHVDLSKYGVPIYPDAKELADENLRFVVKGSKEVMVMLESHDDPKNINDYYKTHMEASAAYGDFEFGSLEGVSDNGYLVQITVARLDTTSMIKVTILETKEN